MNKGFMITAVLLEIIGILLILFWEINDKVAVISGIAIIVIGVVLFQVGYWRMIRARERRKNRN
jgi:membrane protein DedA with SNARE-associated domain